MTRPSVQLCTNCMQAMLRNPARAVLLASGLFQLALALDNTLQRWRRRAKVVRAARYLFVHAEPHQHSPARTVGQGARLREGCTTTCSRRFEPCEGFHEKPVLAYCTKPGGPCGATDSKSSSRRDRVLRLLKSPEARLGWAVKKESSHCD